MASKAEGIEWSRWCEDAQTKHPEKKKGVAMLTEWVALEKSTTAKYATLAPQTKAALGPVPALPQGLEGANAVIGSLANARALFGFSRRVDAALASGTPAPAATKPAPAPTATPAPKPTTPEAVKPPTAEQIGKSVLKVVTSPDAKIRAEGQKHLEGLTGLAKATAILESRMPNKVKEPRGGLPEGVGLLSGTDRAVAHMDWERTGTLSKQTLHQIATRKKLKR